MVAVVIGDFTFNPGRYLGTPADMDGFAERMTRLQNDARAAGFTSADVPSNRQVGSVLDDLSARTELAKALGAQRVRNLLAHAEHFLLDDDAGARIVRMVESNARLINELRPFARRPYPTMTISLPTRALNDADRETLILLGQYKDINAFALVLRDTRTSAIAPIPGWYGVPNGKHDDEGRTVIRLDDAMPGDERMKYAAVTYSMAIDAVLLMLNQKRGIHISEPTLRRRSIRAGRAVTYFARSTIKLSLDNPEELRQSFTSGTHASPRRHPVRGHYFHRGGDRSCTHRWADLDGHEGAFECVDCERRRFWRRDFERGDIERGVVSPRYLITGGGDA